jgi:hypothetical protein
LRPGASVGGRDNPSEIPKEDYVSSVGAAGGQSSKRAIALVLAVVGALFLILGIIYLAVPAGSLPSLLGHISGSKGHHALRMTLSFVAGVVCLAVAWFLNRGAKVPSGGSTAAPADAASRDAASRD